ncbi:MAG: hypothetical protein BZ136_08435, partial [Methanosphaera sp. rholeuAM74]
TKTISLQQERYTLIQHLRKRPSTAAEKSRQHIIMSVGVNGARGARARQLQMAQGKSKKQQKTIEKSKK